VINKITVHNVTVTSSAVTWQSVFGKLNSIFRLNTQCWKIGRSHVK